LVLDWARLRNPNHRATSLRVESGTWLVCSERDFEGDCRVLGPGEYPDLPGALVAGISSAEQVWRSEYGNSKDYLRQVGETHSRDPARGRCGARDSGAAAGT
jgi:hypothetical protein